MLGERVLADRQRAPARHEIQAVQVIPAWLSMSGSLVVLLAALAELANGLSMTAAGPRVYLTREAGKNGKLQTLLEHRGVPSVELPCIEFQSLPGAAELPAMLTSGSFGWVVITSPEAASVFLEAWAACDRPALRVATVGAASASVLDAAGLPVEFVPSKATAKVLAARAGSLSARVICELVPPRLSCG